MHLALYIFEFFVGLCVISVSFIIWYIKFSFKYFEKRGIPFLQPAFPYGSAMEIKKRNQFGFFLRDHVEYFKQTFGFFVFWRKFIVVSEPERLKQILVKDFNKFRNHNRSMALARVDGLLKMEDDTWKRVRSVLSPCFSSGKIKQTLPLLKDSIEKLCGIVKLKSENSEVVNVNRLFEAFTMEVIGATAFGVQLDSQNNPDEIFLTHCRKVLKNIEKPRLYILKQLHMMLDAEGNMLAEFWDRALEEFYQKKRKIMNESTRSDLLQAMMERVDTAEGTGVTKQEVKGNMLTFLIAGYETTSNTLSYTMYLLALNQDCQKKLQYEIDDNIGEKNITYDEVMSMKYLDQVIKESLRIYPPAHTNDRLCNETTDLGGGLVVEKGVCVIIPMYALHHSDLYWEQPEQFDPERFSPENESSMVPYTYLPFSEGPRQCIGMRFAQLEAKVALVEVLRSYTVVPCDDTEVPLPVSFGVTMTPTNGIKLKFIKRS